MNRGDGVFGRTKYGFHCDILYSEQKRGSWHAKDCRAHKLEKIIDGILKLAFKSEEETQGHKPEPGSDGDKLRKIVTLGREALHLYANEVKPKARFISSRTR